MRAHITLGKIEYYYTGDCGLSMEYQSMRELKEGPVIRNKINSFGTTIPPNNTNKFIHSGDTKYCVVIATKNFPYPACIKCLTRLIEDRLTKVTHETNYIPSEYFNISTEVC
jgi:hypothetical protein